MAYNHSVMKDSHRAEYLTEKILRMAKRTVWALQQQLKKGDFDPVGYELKFTTELQTDSMHIVCGEDGHLDLNGKIDRMDICEEDGKRYLRIIDYKSGHTAFDLSSVYYGLQMQLMVYMNAACEIEKKKQDVFAVIPSGVLYYHIDDPLIQTESVDTFMNESDDEIKILESLVMNGLVVDDPEVLRHMDTHPQDTPKVIPVSYKKDGTLSALSSAVAPEKFDVLSWHVRKKAEDLSNRIFAGQIPVHPYRYARRTACDYCNYRSVCGFDSSIRGFEWHQMKKMKKDEVWQKIGKEAGKWDLNGPESRKQS
jgi:ATP-dependent helicase/nuclease subunit B